MGDSDDDYDRRRARDKFRRERSDYQERRGGEERGRREDYVDSRREMWTRDRGGRRDYRDVDMRRRERYSPPPRHDMSPPMKKIRRSWDDHGGYGNYDMPYSGSSMMERHQNWGGAGPDLGGNAHGQHGYGPGGAGHRDMDMCPTQPPMMAFKQFLGSQDDSISDEEAVRKYNDYKDEFRRQQLNEFFLSHKEEEWFKSKYQPEECEKRRQEQLNALKKRIEVFFELLDKERMDGVAVDIDKGEEIIKLLDAVVIKLEGGSDHDLDALNEPIPELEKPEKSNFSALGSTPNKDDATKKSDSQQNNGSRSEPKSTSEKPEEEKNRPKTKKRRRREDGEEEEEDAEDGKLNYDNEESVSDWEKEGDEDSGRPDSAASSTAAKSEKLDEAASTTEEDKTKKEEEVKVKEEEETKEEEKEEEMEEGKPKEDELEEGEKDDAKSEEGGTTVDPVKSEPASSEDPSPRALHKTCSIFLRNLAPTITKQEVEAMCRRFPGFLRVAIADPQPERRFFRRGWVTFERGVNIKETCWHLNNIRLRDCELGAIVNRDLTRRIRSCNGIASHKQVVRADIKLAARIIQTLDKRHSLWTDGQEAEENGQLGFGLISRNPLLKNITDYLIEEADAEEEELLGKSGSAEETAAARKDGSEGGAETTVERDEALIKVVDKLLLYLRIIHSVDYYNHSDYPNEDEMPNRCGIMHARGPAPSIKVTQTDVNDYMSTFEKKMSPFLQPLTKLADEEAQKLGRKDPGAEVEKFITANTQELGKDKWLCPLSGKKFKGPEFVKKHIFNKHGEKVEEVKKEVEYFNNYLMDPKRPQLPEHPGNRPPREPGAREGFGHPGGGYPHPPPYGFPYPNARIPGNYASGFGGRGGYENYRGGGGFYHKRGGGRNRGDPREIIGYHDLDAPDLEESF